VFDFPIVTIEDDRESYGEQRFASLGWMSGRVVMMVWTERNGMPTSSLAGMVKKMKPVNTSRRRFTQAEIEAAVVAAPDEAVYDPDNPPTKPEDWGDAFVSHSLQEFREQVAQRRVRGPGKAPAKTAIQLRLAPDALARWKASGPGWQTRMAELLAAYAP